MRRVLILLSLSGAVASLAAQAPVSSTEPGSGTTLRLSAIATRTIAPDYAVLRLQIKSEERRAADAGRSNARLVSGVMDGLRRAGIQLDSLATGSYAVQPGMRNREGRTQGYVATTELIVVMRDLARIGEVRDVALDAGATGVAPVSFGATFLDATRDSAYAAAVRDVQRRAGVIATAVGSRTARLLEVNANEQRGRVPCAVCLESPERPDPTTAVTPGLIAVTVHVNALFRLEIESTQTPY